MRDQTVRPDCPVILSNGLMRTRFILSMGLTCLTCLSVSTPALAAVTLPTLFSDHMVVQRNLQVPVWGTETANQSITVKLGTQQATGKAGTDGKWTVRLPAQDAGGPFSMTVTGSSTVTVADAYVGEVWIGSGQSNMEILARAALPAETKVQVETPALGARRAQVAAQVLGARVAMSAQAAAQPSEAASSWVERPAWAERPARVAT